MDEMQNDISNTCLDYTDEQKGSIIEKIDNLKRTVNTTGRLKAVDNEVYNLVNKRIDEVEKRVDQL